MSPWLAVVEAGMGELFCLHVHTNRVTQSELDKLPACLEEEAACPLFPPRVYLDSPNFSPSCVSTYCYVAHSYIRNTLAQILGRNLYT